MHPEPMMLKCSKEYRLHLYYVHKETPEDLMERNGHTPVKDGLPFYLRNPRVVRYHKIVIQQYITFFERLNREGITWSKWEYTAYMRCCKWNSLERDASQAKLEFHIPKCKSEKQEIREATNLYMAL